MSLAANLGSLESLNDSTRCGCNPCRVQMRRTEDGLISTTLAIAAAVQWVASCGGAWLVSATTRSTVSGGSGGMREGRVLSRVSPLTPSCIKRSCQRHTTVLPLPTARMTALVPWPSAVSRTIRARQTCFCGLLRCRIIDCKRARSAGVTSMAIPLRISHNDTAELVGKPQSGLFRQVLSTSPYQSTCGGLAARARHPTYRAMTSNVCRKCGRIIRSGLCICMFASWAVAGPIKSFKPPPAHAANAIFSAAKSAMGTTSFVDQVTGQKYTEAWPNLPGRGWTSGPTGAHVEVAGSRISPTGTTSPADYNILSSG